MLGGCFTFFYPHPLIERHMEYLFFLSFQGSISRWFKGMVSWLSHRGGHQGVLSPPIRSRAISRFGKADPMPPLPFFPERGWIKTWVWKKGS